MTVRHGFLREDEQKSLYVLDLDAFDEQEGRFVPSDIVQMMWQFKKWTWTVFYRSITKALADYLGPTPLDD